MEILTNIIKIDCMYQFKGEIKENYNWNEILLLEFSSYLSKKRFRKIFNLKGLNIDKSDSQDEEQAHSGMHIYDRMTLFRDSKYYFKEKEKKLQLKL